MPTNDEILESHLDDFAAAKLTLMAFMMEVSVRLAVADAAPVKWAQDFIQNLHRRLDQHEKFCGEEAVQQPIHEAARENIDTIGRYLLESLQVPPA